jgi:hypothetical protein
VFNRFKRTAVYVAAKSLERIAGACGVERPGNVATLEFCLSRRDKPTLTCHLDAKFEVFTALKFHVEIFKVMWLDTNFSEVRAS